MSYYENAATADCLRALEYLRQQAVIDEFYLAGGTALALQIGHRVSTDLDWFSITYLLLTLQREALRQALDASGEFEVVSEQDGMMFTRLLGTDYA
ncbi:MAG TPA: nucleotidyl transferase AbiEii/AbiGii toxin family protein [Anaerolineae bacterium]